MRAVPVGSWSALCASLVVLAVLPATATATATQAEIEAAIESGVQYLRDQQVPESGEPREPGGILFEHGRFGSDWVATALAAAGVDSAEVAGELAPGQKGPSLQDFLLREYGASTSFWGGPPQWLPEEYERTSLVAYAAGLDPARLSADVNLPAQLAGSWNPATGSFGPSSPEAAYYTAFGLLALAKTPMPAWALAPAVERLRQLQESDGGWTELLISTSDTTGTAVAALCEAGVPAYDATVASALSYLKGQQVAATGAIEPGNAESTSSLVSALIACGIDPQGAEWTTTSNKTPIDYLLTLQVPSGEKAGGFSYEPGEEPNLYSSAFALRAIAGGVFTAEPPSQRPVPTVAAGSPVPHALAIQLAPGNVRMCKVTAPAGAPLTDVLAAARASSYPPGCVKSLLVSGGEVEAIDGIAAASDDESWLVRLDRGATAVAGQQPVGFGDLISLRRGATPLAPQMATGPTGASGAPGPSGQPGEKGAGGKRGRRGPRGKAGRNAMIACKVRHRRSRKPRIRCTVKRAPRRSASPGDS